MADTILVTGAAGFVGHAVAKRLLERGERVLGLDNLNSYYDPTLKSARLDQLTGFAEFDFQRGDIADGEALKALVQAHGVRRVVHLAAQAGVRYSLEQPFAYAHSNLNGHLSVLEACRAAAGFEHLVYASSSSVYGNRPLGSEGFSEDEPCAEPVSLYAASKRACELMSESYRALFGFPQTGLRFFTVYGPWGRPDMAYFSFTRKILAGEPIEVFGNGEMARDFTYVDDIVDGILGALDHPPARGAHRLLNIGDNRPVGLTDMIAALEAALGRTADKVMRPMQPGDVTATWANIDRLHELTGYRPQVPVEEGLRRFARWYLSFYGEGRQGHSSAAAGAA
jgi:UDP-glucuronate 4-epimerase